MTEDELEMYNGSQPDKPIYIALSGKVYDVSTALDWYGPKATYSAFAGRACTRGISLPSLKQEDIHDDVSDFTEEQLVNLKYWNDFFNEKYPVIAVLIPDDAEARANRIRKHIELKTKDIVPNVDKGIPGSDSSQYEGGRVFTELELRAYDGSAETDGLIYLSFGGHVLDVSKSAFLYGKGMPRECYAGRIITRISARMIAKDNKPDSPCNEDDLQRGNEMIGLTVQELSQLKKKVKFFLEKFDRVGRLENTDLILP